LANGGQTQKGAGRISLSGKRNWQGRFVALSACQPEKLEHAALLWTSPGFK
jgi:hypothetical protein